MKRQGYGKARKAAGNVAKVAAIMILPLFVIYGAYQGILQVVSIRASKVESVNGVAVAKEKVVGFKELPIYPGSQFVYKDYIEEESVKKFLSNGESVYRLPPDIVFKEVADYYNAILPSSGWEHILSVPRTSNEMMYGEYWIKKDGENALRIYNKLNDIWYQKISVEEAKSGLAAQVRLENERELIISSTEGNEFLPHFPWNLKVPNEYLIRYYDTEIENSQGVELKKIGKDEKVFLEPLGRAGSLPPDVMLVEFIERVNSNDAYISKPDTESGSNSDGLLSDTTDSREAENREEEFSGSGWKVVSSTYIEYEGRSVLEAQIAAPGMGGTAYVFENYRSGQMFVLTSFSTENQMIDYMLKNLQDKRSGYTKDDFEF